LSKIQEISIIFPIYNEEKRIINSLKNISKFLTKQSLKKIEIILVNDGSNDQTENNIKFFINKLINKKIKYIKLNKNKGKGYALKKGILAAKYNWTLTCDIDLSVGLNQINIWNDLFLQKNSSKIFFSSRNHNSSIVNKKVIRSFLGKLFTFFIKLILKINITDTQCGFKLYDTKTAKNIFSKIKFYGYIHDVEITLICKNLNLDIIELPVRWSHKSNGKLNILIDSIIMFIDILKLRKVYEKYF
jgi:dolichyl-phosphate beta-glucosyltransferase